MFTFTNIRNRSTSGPLPVLRAIFIIVNPIIWVKPTFPLSSCNVWVCPVILLFPVDRLIAKANLFSKGSASLRFLVGSRWSHFLPCYDSNCIAPVQYLPQSGLPFSIFRLMTLFFSDDTLLHSKPCLSKVANSRSMMMIKHDRDLGSTFCSDSSFLFSPSSKKKFSKFVWFCTVEIIDTCDSIEVYFHVFV